MTARMAAGLALLAAPKTMATGIGVAATSILPWGHRRSMHGRMETEHSRFIAAAETSLDGFCLLDATRDGSGQIIDFCATYLNRNMESFTGRSRAELKGKRLNEVLAQGTGTLFRELCQVVETGDPASRSRAATFRRPTIMRSSWSGWPSSTIPSFKMRRLASLRRIRMAFFRP